MNRRNQNKRIVVDTLLDLIAGNVCISDARYLLMTLAHRWTACGYQVLQRLDERVRLSRPGPGLKSKTCARVDTGSEPLECLLRDTFGGAFCIVQHRVTRGDRHSARDVGAVRREWFACEPLQPFSNVFRHLPGGLLNRILQREIGLFSTLLTSVCAACSLSRSVLPVSGKSAGFASMNASSKVLPHGPLPDSDI